MEPHREEPQKALEPSAAQKPKRFRIVKLEERIAPRRGGGGQATQAGPTCPAPGTVAYPCTITDIGDPAW
jgi:hypothetical protein